MDIGIGIDFKENLLSLRNYISLGFSCDDIDFKNAAIAFIDRMMEEVLDDPSFYTTLFFQTYDHHHSHTYTR